MLEAQKHHIVWSVVRLNSIFNDMMVLAERPTAAAATKTGFLTKLPPYRTGDLISIH
jgi:hypothetical protein